MLKILTLLLSLLASQSLWATTFTAVDIEDLIKPADAAFVGTFLGDESVKSVDEINEDFAPESEKLLAHKFKILTKSHFLVEKEIGVFYRNQVQFIDEQEFNPHEISIYTPGGIVEGEALRIEGAPDFKKGSKYLVLLKKVDERFWVSGLSMSVFQVIKAGNQDILNHAVYPHNPQLSRLELEKVLSLIESAKKMSFRAVVTDKYDLMREKQKTFNPKKILPLKESRSIASQDHREESGEKETNITVTYWLLAILSLMGGLTRWLRRKSIRR